MADGDPRARGATLTLALAKRRFRMIRESRFRPIGIVGGLTNYSPVMLEDEWEGLLKKRLFSLTLSYGPMINGPQVRVTTRWSGHSDCPPLEYELGLAENRDLAIGRGDFTNIDVPIMRLPAGPFKENLIEVRLDDHISEQCILSYKNYSAAAVVYGNYHVHIIWRDTVASEIELEIVHDLEPFFLGFISYVKSWSDL